MNAMEAKEKSKEKQLQHILKVIEKTVEKGDDYIVMDYDDLCSKYNVGSQTFYDHKFELESLGYIFCNDFLCWDIETAERLKE
jgi:hypothetical protein